MNTTAIKPRPNWVRTAISNRIVQIGIAVWAGFSIAIPFLAHGTIPFDQPSLTNMSYGTRVAIWVTGPFFAFVFIAVAYALTRNRTVSIAERAPKRAVALRETISVLIYGAVVLIGAQFVSRLLGVHRIGLHLTGSMFGLSESVLPREAYIWAVYNFVFFAALPYVYFRRHDYSNEKLCLVPRYYRLTGSTAATCVLSGFTYASLEYSVCLRNGFVLSAIEGGFLSNSVREELEHQQYGQPSPAVHIGIICTITNRSRWLAINPP